MIVHHALPAHNATAPAVLFSSIGSKDKAASAVRRRMFSLGYNPTIQSEAYGIIRRDGDLVECISTGRIEPEDIEELTRALEDGFEPVSFDDPAWDADDDQWSCEGDEPLAPTDAELAVALTKPRDIPTPEDSAAFAALDGRRDVRVKPTTFDWSDYVAWANWRDEAYPAWPDISEAEWAEIGFRAGSCY